MLGIDCDITYDIYISNLVKQATLYLLLVKIGGV